MNISMPVSRTKVLWTYSQTDAGGFTLIELFAVLGTIAMLSLLLIPAMAGMQASSGRMQCGCNLRQVGDGFRLFEQDHNDMFPPAAVVAGSGSSSGGSLTWDSYIHRYIGGTAPDSMLTSGLLPIQVSPKVLDCPTDTPGRNPKAAWVGDWLGLRSYAMISVGQGYANYVQVDASNGYKLPTPIVMGAGIYWVNAPSADWDAKSYRSSIVMDPAGTAIIAEQPDQTGICAYAWGSICIGPLCFKGNAWAAMYQMEHASTADGNQGWPTYMLHGIRFNYLFQDNHVEPLPIGQTVGTGTLANPKGIWTVATGD